jgi:ubiquinone/menaquinone biosynthesis C-methylase UbiE
MADHPVHACIGRWLPLNKGQKVLELGCGPGKYVAMLSTLGFDVVGVDPYYFKTWDVLQSKTNVKLIDKIYAEKLPFTDQYFDHVVCLGALLYFDDPLMALKEIKRIIKPGGKVIIRTVNKNNLYTLNTGKKLDPSSNQLYTMEELVALISMSGLGVSHSFSYGYWPPVYTNFWWYLTCVWIPLAIQDKLSDKLPEKNRVNNIVYAYRPENE